MTKWQIRPVGQQTYLTLDVNPSSYNRSKQVEVAYDQLADGSQCRIVAPVVFKKDQYNLVWANVTQSQLDTLMGFINQTVEIVDHLLATTTAVIDGVERQYLITGTSDQRYAVSIKVQEV